MALFSKTLWQNKTNSNFIVFVWPCHNASVVDGCGKKINTNVFILYLSMAASDSIGVNNIPFFEKFPLS